LPEGVQRLLQLAQAVPEKAGARRSTLRPPVFQRIGESALARWDGGRDVLAFLGENARAFGNLLRGRAQFRWADARLVMQECGPEALGIVALINFLVGLILAFVGAVQLTQFGASIYVADLVAIGAVREMGCIMTGIILCGRTGAAFAAQLGSMKVNEEIDAFRTFGIAPVEFLVLPRVLALVLMMPLLCVFADLIAIFGGYVVSVAMLDVTPALYIDRTIEAITLKSFLLGVFKGSFFGVLVALTGCLRGMQCGNNAAAVGQATTSAVVAGITSIIVADGVFAVLCNALHI
jgi:phospholipid/cholesterol/gamma-HCH transport system permease protein